MEIEMTVKGPISDPITNMPIVILRDSSGGAILPIWVGIYEANAIALEIEKVPGRSVSSGTSRSTEPNPGLRSQPPTRPEFGPAVKTPDSCTKPIPKTAFATGSWAR